MWRSSQKNMGYSASCISGVMAVIAPPCDGPCTLLTGFKVQGAGFRVQGSGFRIQGSGFKI